MLRGRIMALNGADVDKMKPPEEGAWVLRGDRGITYAAAKPDNVSLTAGAWWAGQLRRPAAGLVFVRGGRRARPQGRRQPHRQRARARHHRAHRQSAAGRMGDDGHQLRHGVFAQRLCRCAALLAGHPDGGGRLGGGGGEDPQRGDTRFSGRHHGQGQGCAGRRQPAGRRARHRDPGGGKRGADRLGAGAFRRARRRQSRPYPRRGDPEDAGRHPADPDCRFLARISDDRPGDGAVRAGSRARLPPGTCSPTS